MAKHISTWQQGSINNEEEKYYGLAQGNILESATTSRAGGMRMAPERSQGHLCWWSLIFKKNFLISVLSDLSVLMTT
jgi:hypothetical protein